MKSGNAQERPANYADSIEAAAGALGRSAGFLQRLKALGCPAFRAGRVYLDEVEAYIAEHQLDELEREVEAEEATDAEIKRERLRRMRFENDVREGGYMLRREHDEAMAAAALEVKAELQAQLEDRGPDLLTMRTREECVGILRRMFDEICRKLHQG